MSHWYPLLSVTVDKWHFLSKWFWSEVLRCKKPRTFVQYSNEALQVLYFFYCYCTFFSIQLNWLFPSKFVNDYIMFYCIMFETDVLVQTDRPILFKSAKMHFSNGLYAIELRTRYLIFIISQFENYICTVFFVRYPMVRSTGSIHLLLINKSIQVWDAWCAFDWHQQHFHTQTCRPK